MCSEVDERGCGETVIRKMKASDWQSVGAIYQQGMDTNLATFETQCPSYVKFDATHLPTGRYVMEDSGQIVGWVALSSISSRCAYEGVAEVSIYIGNAQKGIGVGTTLLTYLIEQSEQEGFWTLQSVIIAENLASIRLHEKCGFRLVGVRERISKDRNGNWRNTVLLEKRSEHAKFR